MRVGLASEDLHFSLASHPSKDNVDVHTPLVSLVDDHNRGSAQKGMARESSDDVPISGVEKAGEVLIPAGVISHSITHPFSQGRSTSSATRSATLTVASTRG